MINQTRLGGSAGVSLRRARASRGKSEKVRNKKIAALSVLFVIYLTDSLLFSTADIAILNSARRYVPVVLGIAMFIENRGKIKLGVFLTCASIFVSMLLAGRVTNGYSYISQAALLLFGYYYAKRVDFETFSGLFVQWMRMIAVASLAAFLFDDVVSGLSYIPTVTNSGFNSYKVLFFTNVPLSASLARRNWGPFWEPGVFQCYLNMALMFVLFGKRKRRMFDICLFIMTALTTLSGAAILPMPLLVLAYLFDQSKGVKLSSLAAAAMACLLVVIAIESGYFDEIVYKVFRVGGDGSSMGYRLGSALANLKATLLHPLFGASPEVQDAIRSEAIQGMTGDDTFGNTNTILAFFSYYGVAVGAYYSARLFGFTANLARGRIPRALLFSGILLITSNENLTLSMLVNVLLFLAIPKERAASEEEKRSSCAYYRSAEPMKKAALEQSSRASTRH